MSVWTISTNGQERSVDAWGIRDLVLQYATQAPDVMTFAIDMDDFGQPTTFGDGQTLVLLRDGVRKFVGVVRHIALSSEQHVHSYTVKGPWDLLAGVTLHQKWIRGVLRLPSRQTKIILGVDEQTGKVTTIEATLKNIIDFASQQAGMPLQSGNIGLGNFRIPTQALVDVRCAEAVVAALRWVPDAVTWFDYEDDPPSLHIARRSDLPALDVDLGETSRGSMVPRYDLQVPCVVLYYEQQLGNVVANVVERVPPTATALEYKAYVATIELAGYSVEIVRTRETVAEIKRVIPAKIVEGAARLAAKTLPAPATDQFEETTREEIELQTIAFQPQNNAWWFKHTTGLFDDSQDGRVRNLRFTRVAVKYEDGADATCTYELIGGTVEPWIKAAGRLAKAGKAKVTGFLDYDFVLRAGGEKDRIQEVRGFRVVVEVTVTNVPGNRYSRRLHPTRRPKPKLVQRPVKPAPVVNPPPRYTGAPPIEFAIGKEEPSLGLAAEIYEALAPLQWDGEFEFTGEVRPGVVLNVPERSDWANARALVWESEWHVDTGTTKVRVGPARNLGPGDLISLAIANRRRIAAGGLDPFFQASGGMTQTVREVADDLEIEIKEEDVSAAAAQLQAPQKETESETDADKGKIQVVRVNLNVAGSGKQADGVFQTTAAGGGTGNGIFMSAADIPTACQSDVAVREIEMQVDGEIGKAALLMSLPYRR